MTEWKTYKLGDICDLVAGFAFKSKDFGDYPNKVVKIADIQPPVVNTNELVGVDLSNYDTNKLRKYIISKGDYVLAMTGATIGKLGRITNDIESYINQRVLTFRPDESIVDKDYLYYQLCSDIFSKYILNHIDSETAQPNISAGSVGGFEISLPSLAEQRRIAGILGAIDDKIENNRRINTNLELQAQALYKQWFVDFEFPNEDGKPYKSSGGKMVDSELGQIPDGWNNIRFYKFCHLSNDRVGGLCVSDYSITNNGITPRGQKYTKQLSQNRAENKLLRKGNLAFGMSRDILNWGIMKDEIGAVSPAYTVYTIGDIDVTYLELYIQSHIAYFRDLIKPAAREGQSIDKGVLNNKMLYYPPKHLLRAFLAIFNSISNNFCIKENETLATLRDTLLPKLMNGEIKL